MWLERRVKENHPVTYCTQIWLLFLSFSWPGSLEPLGIGPCRQQRSPAASDLETRYHREDPKGSRGRGLECKDHTDIMSGRDMSGWPTSTVRPILLPYSFAWKLERHIQGLDSSSIRHRCLRCWLLVIGDLHGRGVSVAWSRRNLAFKVFLMFLNTQGIQKYFETSKCVRRRKKAGQRGLLTDFI